MSNEEALKTRIAELEAEIKSLKNSIVDNKDNYGLHWIDVPEAFEKESEEKIPVLEEVKELAVKNEDGKPTHILIEGDNYHALKCLNYTHKGKIDIIYIDPPYNTGKEFIYKDKRMLDKFPNGQTIDANHPLRHSAWLSFMSKRLELAKNLLSEHGVIFISIDNNEQANLKLLCDQVFGEKNFVECVCWNKKDSAKGVPPVTMMVNVHEYILVYQKKVGFKFLGTKRTEEGGGFKNPDNDPRGPWRTSNIKSTTKSLSEAFTITDPNTGRNYTNTWAFSKESLEKMIIENRILWKNTLPKQKEFLYEMKNENMAIKSAWGVFDAQSTTVFLKQLLPNKKFDNPKPISLMQYLLEVVASKSSTVLDFFAGSGTTMHAVMALNAEDGGNRQCILVQQNENNICREITFERNRRVMCGYENAKGDAVAGLGNSLKYYKTAFVGKHIPAEATDEDKIALAHKAGHLLALAENTLDEIYGNAHFQIFKNAENRYTGVYFSSDLSAMAEFAGMLEKLRDESCLVEIAAYIYSLGDVEIFEDEFKKLKRIRLYAIPQPIIEIYKQLNA